jgi:hypothetical protein
VLGFVTGGLTALASLMFLILIATAQEDDPATMLLILGLPCAVGLIAGAARLLGRRSPALLFGSAVVAVVVLLAAQIAAVVALDGNAVLGIGAFVVLALPLPILTAVFARLPNTVGWAEARPLG